MMKSSGSLVKCVTAIYRSSHLTTPCYARPTPSLYSTMATKYKLQYFPFRVIGEPIRWQFAVAGVPFTDERLPRDDTWETGPNGKQHVGFGRLPILAINDGELEITQSCAISRYLAEEFGQLPSTPLLRTRADELIDTLQDLRLCWRPWVGEFDPDRKLVLEQELKSVHFPFYLPKIEAFVRKHGQDGYAVGDELSWADFYLANFTQIWSENHGLDIFSKTPFLLEHMHKIVAIPQIRDWIENRPKSKI